MNDTNQEEETYAQHRVLSVYYKHISADHLQLKREYENFCPHVKIEKKCLEDKTAKNIMYMARKRKCDLICFWETKNHTDLYLYLAQSPQGPTARFHVIDIKSSKSMRFSGNFAKNTRPIINFSSDFDELYQLRVIKELLKRFFQSPYLHFKQAPFVDHIFQFVVTHEDALKIDFHSYQIDFADKHKKNQDAADNILLTEAGPEFSLIPTHIFEGTMTGNAVWVNPHYLTRTEMRQIEREKILAKVTKKQNEKLWSESRQLREKLQEDMINKAFSAEMFYKAFSE